MLLTIEVDHSYSKHWSESYLTNTSNVLSLKRLLEVDEHNESKAGNLPYTSSWERKYRSGSGSLSGSDEEIDVCEVEEVDTRIGSSSWHCVEQKARSQMNECERQVTGTSKHAGSHFRQDCESYWEDNIDKSHWNAAEAKLFNKVIKILNGEKLARLAYKGNSQDIVLRRLSVDRSSARLRSALVDVGWKVKLTQWLHGLLMEKLPPSLLSCYLDVMQTLRSKVPTLIERMIMPSRDAGGASSERLGMLLKRPWDPAVTSVVSDMKQKPAHSVLFIVVQCAASQSSIPVTSWRLRFWNTLLSQVGKVVQVTAPSDDSDEPAEDRASQTVADLARRSFKTVCRKVKDISSRHPHRKVVLIGWHASSILNCHVALKEEVSAIVCLGFPMFTMFGKRGAIDDVLCDLTTPTLFVTGDRASFCDVNDLEDARELTFTDAVTSAVVVSGADDWLRVSENRKRKLFQTQCMIDRKILEEICDFLHTIFQPACERKESFWSSADCESALSRKRPSSTGDIHGANSVKRQRSSSPLVTSQRHSTNSAQINQLLSNQKRATEQDGSSSKLQGISFDLQTGSVSGLSSVPTSSSEINRSFSTGALSLHQQSSAPKWKNKVEPQSSLSRSITIDLTKDPNAQLSSAMSKRKSQLLHPTESQTEAAVAAILGGETESNTPQESNSANDKIVTSTASSAKLTPSQTAIMSPSASLGRYASTNSVRTTSSSSVGKSIAAATEKRFSLTLGAGIGNISSKSVTSSGMSGLRTGFKPVRGGLGRFNSVDQASVIASRSRKDDRETQQATAILEQLTSSLDAGMDPKSRSNSPESFGSEFKTRAGRPPRRGGISSRRGDRHSFDSSAPPRGSKTVSTSTRTPAGRVRTRGSRRGSQPVNQPTRSTTPATNQPNTPTDSLSASKPIVRYLLTSSGLKGVTSDGRDVRSSRQVALMPERRAIPESSLSPAPPMISAKTTPRIFTPTSRKHTSLLSEAPRQQRQSPLNELMLHSVSSSSQTKPLQKTPGKLPSTTVSTVTKSFAGKVHSKPQLNASGISLAGSQQLKLINNPSVIYPRRKVHPVAPSVQRLPTIVKQQTLLASSSNKAVGTLVTRKNGDRALLSITRPRATSATTVHAAKVLSVTRSTSDATSEKSKTASVGMPSLVLTKISKGSTADQRQNCNDKSTL